MLVSQPVFLQRSAAAPVFFAWSARCIFCRNWPLKVLKDQAPSQKMSSAVIRASSKRAFQVLQASKTRIQARSFSMSQATVTTFQHVPKISEPVPKATTVSSGETAADLGETLQKLELLFQEYEAQWPVGVNSESLIVSASPARARAVFNQ